jgi:uncharacterized protein (TIGR02453 family)
MAGASADRKRRAAGKGTPGGDRRFSPATLAYLRGLARHNRKPWFEAHRAEYELAVREPLRELVEQMDVRFARFAPEIVGDPRRSPFRIYRDVRFSNDKSPYKTHASCWFFHQAGSRAVGREASGGGAGFYFQIGPGASFTGGGIWMPPREALGRLREAIAEDHRRFAKMVTDAKVMRRFGGLTEEAVLKRPPRGYAPDHPALRWLKFQSFTLGRDLTDAEATSERLPDLLEADYRLMLPLVRWINAVLGLAPAARR